MSNTDTIKEQTRTVAREFILGHYANEHSLFNVFWDSFASYWDFESTPSPKNHSASEIESVIKDISFAKANAVDLVTPVILATVAEIVTKMSGNKLSAAKIKDYVGAVAVKYGAGVELTACLTRHLPALCNDAFSIQNKASEAIVSKAPSPQFQIWTDGEMKIADSIEKYEKQKKEYLFWIDLDESAHISEINPGKRIGPEAIHLLRRLIESLGTRVAVSEFLGERYDTRNDSDNPDKNKIEQQLTKLQQFCNGEFRGYLFDNWFQKGLGLKESFSNKYFLFSRLNSSKS